jgi:hypothetical protein
LLLKLKGSLLVLGCAVGFQAAGRFTLEDSVGTDTGEIGAVKNAGSETEKYANNGDIAHIGAGTGSLRSILQASEDAGIEPGLSRYSSGCHC